MCFIRDLKFAPLLRPSLDFNDRCFSPKGIIFNGVHFRSNCVVTLKGNDSFAFPIFGMIEEIAVIEDTPRLCLQIWETVDFDDRLQAYQVQPTHKDVVEFSNLHCHTTLSFWKKYNDEACFISKRIYNHDCD